MSLSSSSETEARQIMNSRSFIVFVCLVVAAAAFVFSTIDQLPDTVATHYGAGGRANGWMTRSGYLLFMMVFLLGFSTLVSFLIGFIPHKLPRLTNIPNRRACLDRYVLPALSEKGVSVLIIRPAHQTDAEAIAKVQVDTWRSTYKGILSDGFLAALSYEQRAKAWHSILSDPKPNQFAYAAMQDAKEIIGFAVGGQERNGDTEYTGELYALYVLEAFQRQGLGHRLTATLARSCIDAGLGSLLVWVLEGNPCRRFY